MKTFSRLTFLLVLGCLSISLSLGFGITDALAQAPSLRILGQTGSHLPDAPVTVTFTANDPAVAAGSQLHMLTVTSVLVNITSINAVAGGAGTYTTNAQGILEVKGTVASTVKTGDTIYIQASWGSKALRARADYGVKERDAEKTTIAVLKPVPKEGLSVGDTFKQDIVIEGVDAVGDVDLSAWQMDVVFNPKILKYVSVTEGDFLKEGGYVPFWKGGEIAPGRIHAYQARVGQMMNDDPPGITLSASPPGVTGDGLLMTVEFQILEFAEEPLGIHNVQLSNSKNERLSYCIEIRDLVVTTHQYPPEDVNRDGSVDILDLTEVAMHIGMVPPDPRADLNNDGFVNVLDLVRVYQHSSWGGSVTPTKVRDSNAQAPLANGNVGPAMIQSWIDLARVEDDGSAIFDLGIANLEALLASRIPSETKLLLNYPNPFNPETWIPYQLAKATDVTITIHSMNGSLIRTIELGHQAAGTYKSKSQAAYWDGRNEFGEQVASGLYFYTLTAGDFSATAKMLVRK